MPIDLQHIVVNLAPSRSAYEHALVEALRQDFKRGFPLLGAPGLPMLALLDLLNVQMIDAQATSPADLPALWQAYTALFTEAPAPPPQEPHLLRRWYQQYARSSSHIVILLNDDLFAPALLYAAFHRLPLFAVSNLQSAAVAIDLLQPRAVTIVAHAHDLSYAALQTIYRLVDPDRLFQEIALGFITGRDLAAVSWMALKATVLQQMLGTGQQIAAWLPRRDLHTTQPHDDQFTALDVYGHKAAFEQVTRQLTHVKQDQLLDLLIIETHGGENNIYFSGGALCGAAAAPAAHTVSGSFSVPPCRFGQPCLRQEAVPVYELLVKHALVISCNGFKLGHPLYPDQYNIGLNMLDGLACTYVGTIASNEIKDYEVFFYVAMVQAGMSAGAAVAVLNQVRSTIPGSCQLMLAGNPETQTVQPAASRYHVEVGATSDQGYTLVVDVVTTPLVVVDLPGDHEAAVQDLVCKVVDASAPLSEPLYFTFLKRGSGLRLYLYTTGTALGAGRYSFEVINLDRRVRPLQERANRLIAACQLSSATQVLPDPLVEQASRDVKQTLAGLAQHLSELLIAAKFTVQEVALIEQTSDRLAEQLNQADQTLLQFLLRHHGAGVLSYILRLEESFYPEAAVEGVRACLCGADATVRSMRHVNRAYSVTGHFCPLCGIIYHGPSQTPYVSFQSISTPIDGEPWTIRLAFRNPTNAVLQGQAGVVLLLNANQLQHGQSRSKVDITYSPQQTPITLQPGATCLQEFTIHTRDFSTNSYGLCVCFVSDFAISFLHSDVYLTAVSEPIRAVNQSLQ